MDAFKPQHILHDYHAYVQSFLAIHDSKIRTFV
jgi:hypothetical protein